MMTRTALKPRQRTFADGVYRGLSLAEAAQQAGYAVRSARQTGSRLMKLSAVQAAIERRKAGYDPNPQFDDPLAFLCWFAADPEAGATRQRVAAAIAALPYLYRSKG